MRKTYKLSPRARFAAILPAAAITFIPDAAPPAADSAAILFRII